MFQFNNKDTRTTSTCSAISVDNFEQVSAGGVLLWRFYRKRKKVENSMTRGLIDVVQ